MGSSADPRDGYCVVGSYGFTVPVGFEFATPIGSAGTTTTITRMQGGEEVASFRWSGASGTLFGSATTISRPGNHHMWDYVMAPPQGAPPHCRLFDSVGPHNEPRRFAWIKQEDAPVYDLHVCDDAGVLTHIGVFGPQNDTSPTFSYRPFASFAFRFAHEALLLDALAALSLNRWLDTRH